MAGHVIKLAVLAVAVSGLAGCTANEETVASQRQSNWANADPAAITAAEIERPTKIMPSTHFAAGQLFEKQGAALKAALQYQKALAVDPDHVPSLNRLGVLYARMDRHPDAEKVLLRSLKIRPDSPLLRNNLGFEYILQRRWADAEAELRNAIQLRPDFARAHINLGLCLAKLDRFDEALDEFRAVLPEPDAFYNLGLMLRSKHRYRDAADTFQLALDFNPSFHAARRQLVQIQPQVQLATDLEPLLSEVHWEALAGDHSQDQDIVMVDHPATSPAAIENDSTPMPTAEEPSTAPDMEGALTDIPAEEPVASLPPEVPTEDEARIATVIEAQDQLPCDDKADFAAEESVEETAGVALALQADELEHSDSGMTLVGDESISVDEPIPWPDEEEMFAETASQETVAVLPPEQSTPPEAIVAQISDDSAPESSDVEEEVLAEAMLQAMIESLPWEELGELAAVIARIVDDAAPPPGADEEEMHAEATPQETIESPPLEEPGPPEALIAPVSDDSVPAPSDDVQQAVAEVSVDEPIDELQIEERIRPIHPAEDVGMVADEPKPVADISEEQSLVEGRVAEPVVAALLAASETSEEAVPIVVLAQGLVPVGNPWQVPSGIDLEDVTVIPPPEVPDYPLIKGAAIGAELEAMLYDSVWEILACARTNDPVEGFQRNDPPAPGADVAQLVDDLLDTWAAPERLTNLLAELPVAHAALFEPVPAYLTGDDVQAISEEPAATGANTDDAPAEPYVDLPPELLPVVNSLAFETLPSDSGLYIR